MSMAVTIRAVATTMSMAETIRVVVTTNDLTLCSKTKTIPAHAVDNYKEWKETSMAV